jgi:hypothetical protein
MYRAGWRGFFLGLITSLPVDGPSHKRPGDRLLSV